MDSSKKSRRDKVINKQNAISSLSSMRTERRHLQTIQIRKSKRNQLLAVKRRLQQTTEANLALGNESSPTVNAPTATVGNMNITGMSKEANAQQLRSLCTKFCELGRSNNATEKSQSSSLLSSIQSYISRIDADVHTISSLLLSNDEVTTEISSPNATTSTINAQKNISSSLAMQFCESLSNTLLNSHLFSYEEQMDASRVLTNLAAIETPSQSTSSPQDDFTNYYGRQSAPNLGWCGILIRSNALAALLQPMSKFIQIVETAKNTSVSSLSSNLHSLFQTKSFQQALSLCEQCCWAIGNLAGDSQEARGEATQRGAIGPLVQCLKFSFQLRSFSSPTIHQNSNIPNIQDIYNSIFGLCRNAAWALSNMARGSTTSALPFLSTVLSQDIAEILLAPDILTSSTQAQSIEIGDTTSPLTVTKINWMEIAYETCWILAFLTAREHEAVYTLCSAPDSNTSQQPSIPIICRALAHSLSIVIRLITFTSPNTSSLDTNVDQAKRSCAFRMFIPCIRAIGNIGTACDGVFVPFLIAAMSETNQAIPQSIASVLEFAINPASISSKHDVDALIPEVVWAAGTLLCDMPYYNKPENMVLPITNMELSQSLSQLLIPTLCSVFESSRSNLFLKKEVGSALWNAVAPSPNIASIMINDPSSLDVSFSKSILLQIIRTPNMIPTLVQLLSKPDADVVFVSLRLINISIRQINEAELITRFDEENILDKLETICENASCEYYGLKKSASIDIHHTHPKSADLAADLIDDFFSDEYVDRQESEKYTADEPENLGSIFSSVGTLAPKNTLSFESPTTDTFAFTSPESNMGVGRGRGRGANKPAWMASNK